MLDTGSSFNYCTIHCLFPLPSFIIQSNKFPKLAMLIVVITLIIISFASQSSIVSSFRIVSNYYSLRHSRFAICLFAVGVGEDKVQVREDNEKIAKCNQNENKKSSNTLNSKAEYFCSKFHSVEPRYVGCSKYRYTFH